MSQLLSKEVYRQSGPREDPANRTVDKIRGREDRSKLARNYEVYFKSMQPRADKPLKLIKCLRDFMKD